MNKKFKDNLVVGFALFAMFFGAGNIIFPPILGLLHGKNWIWAALGFMATDIGFSVIGVIATARLGGSIEDLAGKVGKWFSKILGIVIILAIGPMLAIPRTAATTYEMTFKPFCDSIGFKYGSILTILVFFAIVLYFTLVPSKLIDNIGKILTPALLFCLLAMIAKALVTPLGPITDAISVNAFAAGFKEGYQTMDALASIIFTVLIVNGIKNMGYKADSEIIEMTIYSSIISAIGLAIVYGGFVFIGATTGTLVDPSISRVALLMFISKELYGSFGLVIIGIAVALACLTTAIGLTATCAEYFEDLSKGKLSYKGIVIVTSLFGIVMATVGVESIIKISAPILSTLYPMVIVLMLLSFFTKLLPRSTYIGAIFGSFMVGLISNLKPLVELGLPFSNALNKLIVFVENMPLAKEGFEWIVPTLVMAIIFTLIGLFFKNKEKAKA